MVEILIGLLAFILYFIYDFNTIHKNYKIFKPLFLISSIILLSITVYKTIMSFENDNILLIILSSIFAIIFFVMMIYTLFFAIQFNETYIKDNKKRLAYTKGVYGISRHPVMLWFLGLFLSLWGLTNNLNAGTFYISMIIGNFIYIVYQDVYIFPKTFINYKEYKEAVRFL